MSKASKSTAIIASVLLLAGSASALAADAKTDKTGMSDLGVDISDAGTTPDQNKAYLDTLSSDEQAQVRQVCLVVVGEEAQHTPEVVAFCRNVNPPA